MRHDERLRWTAWPQADVARYRRLGVFSDETLWSALAQRASAHPDRVALVDGRGQRSYGALHDRALQLARALTRRGVKPGQRVLLALDNCSEWLEVFFALQRLGAVPIMAQPAHRLRELSHFCSIAQPVAHFAPRNAPGGESASVARVLREQHPALELSVSLAEAVDGEPSYEQLLAEGRDTGIALPAAPAWSDLALLQLSGGSTALPKLIPRVHADYAYSVRKSVEVCRLGESSVYLAVLPVAHNFTLSSPGVLGALWAGGKVVLSASPAPHEAFPWIERERVTLTALVPALVPVWLNARTRTEIDLSSLGAVLVGGAKLPPAHAEALARAFEVRLQQVFGMAEGLVCYTRPSDSPETCTHTQGRPMSEHDELRVVDDHDRDVPRGQVGHLLTRGPYTIRGYLGTDEHNREAFTPDGFYRTGDLVKQTAEGNLVVMGRSKDQINRGGEKISAPEVEAALIEHPDIEAAAVVSMPDPYLGERSCAFVVLGQPLRPAQVRAHLREAGLALFKVPDRIEPCPDLPKTPVGKIDKPALQKTAAALAAAAAPPTKTAP